MKSKQVATPILTLAVFSFLAAGPSSRLPDPRLEEAIRGIRAEALRAHVRFLADDLLEGRGTGTRGYDLGARYVAAQFEQMGLQAAGVHETYFQAVQLRKIELIREASSLNVLVDGKEQALKFGEDFVMRGHAVHTETSVEAPVVFVGFGVTAPELGYDDYAGVEVWGKIVASLSGAPPRFGSTQRAHYSSNTVKAVNAAARGAVGSLRIWTPQDEERYPWPRIVRFFKGPSMHWLDPKGVPNDAFPEIQGRALLSRRGAEILFSGAPRSLDEVFSAALKSQSQSFPLPATVRIRQASRHSALESPNIAAVLRGSDPRLRDEYVVYSAHLDHEGIGEPVEGDAIYNGAVDNASGVAVLLEVARAFTRLPKSPRRSVIFLAVTAEEHGLLGSDYFARFPTVAQEKIVANINVDGTAVLYPLRDVVAFGAEHSALGDVVGRAASQLAVELSPDPIPDEVLFIRSDQYSFVRQGIPAVYLMQGLKTSDPKLESAAVFRRWMRTRYHTPQDDIHQPLDFGAAMKYARLNFLIGYKVAQQSKRPAWNRGDFFGEKYGPKRR